MEAKSTRQRPPKVTCEAPEVPPADQVRGGMQGRRVVSNDPGLENVFYVVEVLADGSVVKLRLTNAQYHRETGSTKLTQSANRCIRERLAHEQAVFNSTSPKTASLAVFQRHVRQYSTVYDAIWHHKLRRRWARGRFGVHIMRAKVIDAFLRRVRGDGPLPIMAYGDGCNISCTRGRRAAPTKFALKRTKRMFPDTVMVPEYLTTQVCHRCHEKTRAVKMRDVEGRVRSVRGLLFCDSQTCKHRWIDRDFNGGFNLGTCATGPRPVSMDHRVPHPPRKSPVWLRRPSGS